MKAFRLARASGLIVLLIAAWYGCGGRQEILSVERSQTRKEFERLSEDGGALPVVPAENLCAVRVTNLADAGPGSLREALERAKGRRTVVFDVAGTIELDSAIAVRHPYVTVDGLSAPSPGITLLHYGLKIRTHDVTIRHIRIHVGDGNKEGDPEAGSYDAIDIAGNNEGMPVRDIIIDHCSLYWAIDEVVCTWSGKFANKVSNVVFSNCIFAESLLESIHPDGPHSCGPFVGYGSKKIFLIRNLIAHCADRTPNICGGTETVVVNNVIYDPWTMFIHVNNFHDAGQPVASIVGNVCIKGPSARDDLRHSVRLSSLSEGARIFVRDNPCDAFVPNDPRSCVASNMPGGVDVFADEPPIWDESISVLPSDAVEERVLKYAGARPHDRDRTDVRLVRQVRTRTGRIISSQDEVMRRDVESKTIVKK